MDLGDRKEHTSIGDNQSGEPNCPYTTTSSRHESGKDQIPRRPAEIQQAMHGRRGTGGLVWVGERSGVTVAMGFFLCKELWRFCGPPSAAPFSAGVYV